MKSALTEQPTVLHVQGPQIPNVPRVPIILLCQVGNVYVQMDIIQTVFLLAVLAISPDTHALVQTLANEPAVDQILFLT